MKKNSVLKILVIVVAVILISLISFVGIYKQKHGVMENILPDYLLGKDVSGYRMVTLKVDESTTKEETDETNSEEKATQENTSEDTNTTNTEENTNTVEENENNTVDENTANNTSTEGNTEQEETKENILTKENFEKSKEIVQNRMKYANISEYNIRVNEEDGTITLELPENTRTDEVLQYLTLKGDFTIIDADTKEVLLSPMLSLISLHTFS